MAAIVRHAIGVGALLSCAAAVGCGGGGRHGTASRPQAPLAVCGALRPTATGRVQTPEATELSGLVLSRTQPDVLWAHNDSGDRARVFALRPDGRVLADLDVPGAEAVDWEDMAARGRRLYLADIGDNALQRPGVDVYRINEPRVPASGTTPPATRLRLRYPDGAHNAETLLADPRSGDLVIVTKEPDGRSGVYVAREAKASGTVRLRRAGRLRLGVGGLATGGDVSADGRVIAIRTYDRVFAWRRRTGTSLAATLRGRPCVSPTSLTAEGQGEALALTAAGDAFFTVPEGTGATIRRYDPAPP